MDPNLASGFVGHFDRYRLEFDSSLIVVVEGPSTRHQEHWIDWCDAVTLNCDWPVAAEVAIGQSEDALELTGCRGKGRRLEFVDLIQS